MKFINEQKYYSLNEITSSLSIDRKDILELEKQNIINPSYKDDNSNYRYYDPLIILKLIEINKLLNAGFSIEEIKIFLENKSNKNELKNDLNERLYSINDVNLFFKDSILSLSKRFQRQCIYYYEYRNIDNFKMIKDLIKNVYIHALEKKYIFDKNSFPFILFLKNNYEENKPLKVKICLPIIREYNENNIEIIKESNVITLDSSLNFSSSYNLFLKSINDKNINIKNLIQIIYYFDKVNLFRINGFIY